MAISLLTQLIAIAIVLCMSAETCIYSCGHARVLDVGNGIVLEVRHPNGSSGFGFGSVRHLKNALQEQDWEGIACKCIRAWAESDACWYCLDGEPVQAHEGKPCCEKCAAAVREGSLLVCSRCGDEPALSSDEPLGARCFEQELMLRNLSASLDLIQDARAVGIEPASVLRAVRDHSKRRAV